MKPFIILLDKCNLNCKYCFYRQKNDALNKELDFDSLKGFLSYTKRFIDNEIMVTGGEPLLYSRFDDLMDYFIESDYKMRLNSNLTLLDTVNQNKLKQAVSRVDTTIDHLDEKIHNLLRGGHNKSMQSLKTLNDMNIPFGISIIMNKNNYLDTEKIYENLSTLNPDYIFFQPVHTFSKKYEKMFGLGDIGHNSLKKMTTNLERWAKEQNQEHKLEMLKDYYLNNKGPDTYCQMIQNNFVINCNGDVNPCFHISNAEYGNLYKDNTMKIIENIKNYDKRKKCFAEKCFPLY